MSAMRGVENTGGWGTHSVVIGKHSPAGCAICYLPTP